MAITKQYQVTDEVEIDFVYKSPSPVVLCPRYENGERAIKVKLKNAGEDYPVPEGYTPYVYGVKFDKKLVDNLCEYDGNIVMVEVTKQLSAVEGRNVLRIALVNDETGEYAQTSVIYLRVTEGADFPGAERSTDEFGALVQYMKQANASAESAKASETSAKSDRIAAQAARAGAEAAESRVNAIVAGNESYTKRQSRDMFARALKAIAEKAEKLEIYPDEGSNVCVTSHGFTEQSGSGDPSPTNVRKITVGGKKLVEVVLDGTESWNQNSSPANTGYLYLRITAAANSSHYAISNILGFNYQYGGNGVFAAGNYLYFGAAFGKQYTLDTWKAYLAARYAAGDPVIVWYQPADESQATGIYTPIESTGAEYSCVCVPLTEHLCDGDTVETCVKSGCDKKIVLDGGVSDGLSYSDEGQIGALWRLKVSVQGVLNYSSGGLGCSNWIRYKADWWAKSDCFYCASNALFVIVTADSFAAAKSALSANPLTVWYRSTAYTPENDIPVCLETHKKFALSLDANSVTGISDSGLATQLFKVGVPISPLMPNTNSSKIVCDNYKFVTWGEKPWTVNNSISYETASNIRIKDSRFTTVEEINANFSELAEHGTPVTIVYELNTPITYAHDPVYLEAYPDGNGKFTISGEKLVSAVYNKSLSKAFEALQSAVLAMGANLSS